MTETTHRRLMDLLAGWAAYVERCAESEEPHPGVTRAEYEREAEIIHDLYQEIGAVEDVDGLDTHTTLFQITTLLEKMARKDGAG